MKYLYIDVVMKLYSFIPDLIVSNEGEASTGQGKAYATDTSVWQSPRLPTMHSHVDSITEGSPIQNPCSSIDNTVSQLDASFSAAGSITFNHLQ